MSAEATTPPWDQLPMETLEQIFQDLSATQLAWTRLVCRRWNSAICSSPSLMWKFEPVFGHIIPLIYSEAHDGAVSARFRRATINTVNVCIMAGSKLWTKIGASIQSLRIRSGHSVPLSVARLAEILGALPNLTHLSVSTTRSEVVYDEESVLVLKELRELEICGAEPRLIALFERAECKSLRNVKFRGSFSKKDIRLDFESITPAIQARRESLQEIEIEHVNVNDNQLQQIYSAAELKLRKLWLRRMGCEINDGNQIQLHGVRKLCHHFPMIESLELKTYFIESGVLEVLRQNLQHLRELSININLDSDCEDLEMFLKRMPQIEALDVETLNECDFVLRDVVCPNLQKLRLSHFIFPSSALTEFLRNTPKLSHLGLRCCEIDDVLDFLDALKTLRSLESLDYLGGTVFGGWMDNPFGITLPTLRTLRTNILSLVWLFPNLKEIDLGELIILDEDVISRLLRTLPKLIVLHSDDYGWEMTDAALDCIATLGRRLHRLRLQVHDDKTTLAARNRLREALKYSTRVDLIVVASCDD